MQRKKLISAATLSVVVASVMLALQSASDAACCYFAAKDKDINQPGQKAFISWNPASKAESFTVQPKFEGNAVDFGMVIPTPAKPKLDEMSRDFFKNLALFTILMPLPQPIYTPMDPPRPTRSMNHYAYGAMAPSMTKRGSSVRVLEAGVVGSLDYKIIVADRADDLFSWLKENKYSYGGDEETLQFYIKKQWFFTVMKIDSNQMKKAADGTYLGEITPTRFTFSSKECVYPLKITQLSVKDKTDALFYVQSPAQMDLKGDWSWMHSYRPMYLTYMLGCGANNDQLKELQERTQWVTEKRQASARYETTKLEWAKRLGDAELSVLENPQKNYGQTGTGNLPPGAEVVPLATFMDLMKAEYDKANHSDSSQANAKVRDQQLAAMEDQYQPSKGIIVRNPENTSGRFISTRYSWYPAREAPLDEVAKLTLLKGHLQKGQWLTKFRKVMLKDEMTQDLVLATIPEEQEQTYTRIMPTSPP